VNLLHVTHLFFPLTLGTWQKNGWINYGKNIERTHLMWECGFWKILSQFLLCRTCPFRSQYIKPRWHPFHLGNSNYMEMWYDDKIWPREFNSIWHNIWHQSMQGMALSSIFWNCVLLCSAAFNLLTLHCVFYSTFYTQWWCLTNGKMEYPLHSL
jgi:hypothetical protein